jgi:uncharacterized protein YggT (Ycf19 family)
MGRFVTQAIYIVFALVETILSLRLILKLFGANASNPFVSWVYETSNSILDPFRGIFPTKVLDGVFVIDFSTIFAMIIYAIIALLLTWVITLITAPIEHQIQKKK